MSVKVQWLILLIVGLLVLCITSFSLIDVHITYFTLPFSNSVVVSHSSSVTFTLVILVWVFSLVRLMCADTWPVAFAWLGKQWWAFLLELRCIILHSITLRLDLLLFLGRLLYKSTGFHDVLDAGLSLLFRFRPLSLMSYNAQLLGKRLTHTHFLTLFLLFS